MSKKGQGKYNDRQRQGLRGNFGDEPGASGYSTNDPGSEITGDVKEFVMAMDRYKAENRKPFPTWSEVLGVLKSLGYKKHGNADSSCQNQGEEGDKVP